MSRRKNSASNSADVGLQAEVWRTAGALCSSSMDAAEYAPGANSRNDMSAPTFLDLFSGCGGFTLGLLRSGLRCLAAVDIDPFAVATPRANLIDRRHHGLPMVATALERDLRRFKPDALATLIGTDRVDVTVGGPPCQGFSTARQVDGANHGAARIQSFPDWFYFPSPRTDNRRHRIRPNPYASSCPILPAAPPTWWRAGSG